MVGVGLAGYLVGRVHGVRSAQRAVAPPPLPPGPGRVIAPPADLTEELPHQVQTEIGRLLARDRKIEAIKVYRDATRVGLKEAKDAIDYWHRRGEPTAPGEGPWPQLPSGPSR